MRWFSSTFNERSSLRASGGTEITLPAKSASEMGVVCMRVDYIRKSVVICCEVYGHSVF